MAQDFQTLLRSYRERMHLSRNKLAHLVGIDPSYVSRTESGGREPPRRYIVEAIARTLRLTAGERNSLLVAAGYTPPSVVQLGEWDACLQCVVEVLTDVRLTSDERNEFRTVVQSIAGRWAPSPALAETGVAS